MEQDGAWGDHLILCAAANCFKTCIRVVSSLQNDVVIRPHGPIDESKPLVLGYIHEVHFVSLQPIVTIGFLVIEFFHAYASKIQYST